MPDLFSTLVGEAVAIALVAIVALVIIDRRRP